MVGVARIELATPAMSMRWLRLVIVLQISILSASTFTRAQNLPKQFSFVGVHLTNVRGSTKLTSAQSSIRQTAYEFAKLARRDFRLQGF